MIQTKLFNNSLYKKEDTDRIIYQEPRTGSPARDDFERDYGRIIHSAAFRRLQSKTQVIGIGEGDFHRTRLTHSMEVAQIARGIVMALNSKSVLLKEENKKIDSSLIEAAALAHDLGHPPFGHQGERALNKMMHETTEGKFGFEGNAQTLRILTRLERGSGLNLTRATLLAILKYPIKFSDAVDPDFYQTEDSGYKPPKSNVYPDDTSVFEWLLSPFTDSERKFYLQTDIKTKKNHKQTSHKTFECSIIELADDIAYATHDLEDAIRLGFIKLEEVVGILKNYRTHPTIKEIEEKLNGKSNIHDSQKIKDFTANLISLFISNAEIGERSTIFNSRIRYYVFVNEELKSLIGKFSDLVYNKVIKLQRVQTIEWKGGHIISEMFNAFYNEKKLLPQDEQNLIKDGNMDRARIVCDYLAGMTDSFAIRMYSRLFEGKESRLFDI